MLYLRGRRSTCGRSADDMRELQNRSNFAIIFWELKYTCAEFQDFWRNLSEIGNALMARHAEDLRLTCATCGIGIISAPFGPKIQICSCGISGIFRTLRGIYRKSGMRHLRDLRSACGIPAESVEFLNKSVCLWRFLFGDPNFLVRNLRNFWRILGGIDPKSDLCYLRNL